MKYEIEILIRTYLQPVVNNPYFSFSLAISGGECLLYFFTMEGQYGTDEEAIRIASAKACELLKLDYRYQVRELRENHTVTIKKQKCKLKELHTKTELTDYVMQ